MVERKQQPINLGSRKIVVWEANWDMASAPSRMEEAARMKRAEAPHTDLSSFEEFIYPWLASYSTGDVPSLEEAFELPDGMLDKWFMAVVCCNPDLFEEEIVDPVTVTFRDDSTLTVRSARLPSSLRRLFHLDNKAHTFLRSQPGDIQEFIRLKLFAKIACCIVDRELDYDEVTHGWPAPELNKLYAAVLRQNPHLFLTEQEEKEALEEEAKQDLTKKNSAPGKSSSSSKNSSRRKAVTSQQL